jgi:Protein of unknown function (DUF998)
MKTVSLPKDGLIKDTSTAKPVTMISQTAAPLSFAAATLFLVLLAALHLLKPELNPSWHVISEYAIGRYGWIMVLAFLSLATSLVTLFITLSSQLRTIVGRIGLGLLLLSAAGMTIAGIFSTDPITAVEGTQTARGSLHELGALLDVTPIAALMISLSLARNPAWFSARRSLLWTAGLPLLGLVLFIVSTTVMLTQNDGEFGPEVLIGWPNRFLVVTYCAWLMTVAWCAIQLKNKNSLLSILLLSRKTRA